MSGQDSTNISQVGDGNIAVSNDTGTVTINVVPSEPPTFATRAEFVARLEGQDLLVGYQHALQGRDKELAALSAFLEHPQYRVAVLPGRGGIGKTKLIYDWTAGLASAQPYFWRQGAEWRAGSPRELPNDGRLWLSWTTPIASPI